MKFIAQLFMLIYLSIKKGSITEKFTSLTFAAVLNIPLTQLIEKYIFNDWEMLGWIMILLCVDTVSGFVKHWNNSNVSSEGFKKLFNKLIVVSGAMITSHVVYSISVIRFSEQTGYIIETGIYSGLTVWLGISVAENLSDITGGKFPPVFIRKHLKIFEKTGSISATSNLEVTSSKEENQ